MADLPDERLVDGALRGNVDSFMELCRRHYPALVAVAHAVLHDGHLAEDAAQESLAKACRSLPNLTKPACFASWVTTICRNQALDLARRSDRVESLGERDIAAEAVEPESDSEAVRGAIAELPQEGREAVYLRYYAGLSYEQMCAVLGVSPQAVNGRLRRARQAIREYLERKADIGEQR